MNNRFLVKPNVANSADLVSRWLICDVMKLTEATSIMRAGVGTPENTEGRRTQ